MTEEYTPEQILRKLNALKNDIDESKRQRDMKIGARDQLLIRLQSDFDIEGLDAAQKRILALDQQITRKNKYIQEEFNKLREEYEF